MSLEDQFNGILTSRRQFEDRFTEEETPEQWGRENYRVAIEIVASEPEIKGVAQMSKAMEPLAVAWHAYGDKDGESPLLKGLSGPVQALFAIQGLKSNTVSQLKANEVIPRFTVFGRDAGATISGEVTRQHAQAVRMIAVLPFQKPRKDHSPFPEIALLDDQLEDVLPMIKAMRHDDEAPPPGDRGPGDGRGGQGQGPGPRVPMPMPMQGMGMGGGPGMGLGGMDPSKLLELFRKRFPVLAGYSFTGFQGRAAAFGAKLPDKPDAGSFAGSTPLMLKRLLLRRLVAFADAELHMDGDNVVRASIDAAAKAVDWARAQTQLERTPFGLMVSVESELGFFTTPSKLKASDPAAVEALVRAAEKIHEVGFEPGQLAELAENRLALMAILHLSGGIDPFIKIMTSHRDDKITAVAKLLGA